MFTPITTHVQQALARLLTQYSRAPLFQGLLTALINPIQDIENALTDMNTLRYLPEAVGQQLDNIGQIVGISRLVGQSDASYLIAILTQIQINTSDGTPEQLISLFFILTAATQILFFEFFPGDYMIQSPFDPGSTDAADQIISILQTASPAGVNCDGIVAYAATTSFAYAGITVALGYGTVIDPTVGGTYPILYSAPDV